MSTRRRVTLGMAAYTWLVCAGGGAAEAAPPASPTPEPGAAAQPFDPWARGIGEGALDSLEVLDWSIAKQLLAFKLVSHYVEDEDGPDGVDCGYEGMGNLPTSGVLLGIWDLNAAQKAETWAVYPPARTRDACGTAVQAKAVLAAAKSRMAALGLDIARRPAPLTLPVGGGTTRVTTTTGSVELEITSAVVASTDPRHDRMARGAITRSGALLFEAVHPYTPTGSSAWAISFPTAVVDGDALVLAIIAHSQPFTWTDRVSFSRPIALK